MDRILRVVLAVGFAIMTMRIISACDRAETPVEISAPDAPVIVVDEVNHTITLTDPAYPSSPVIIRVDTTTRTQYIDCGGFHVINGTNWFVEYTTQDYFEMSFEELGNGLYVERYYFNGRVLELEIDELTGFSPEQGQQFSEFLPTDPAVNSLADHPDGKLMADVFTRAEPGLVSLAQVRAAEGPESWNSREENGLPEVQLLRPDWRGWIQLGCAAAGMCRGVVCKLFPGNPVCQICGGISLLCVLGVYFNPGGFFR